MNPYAPPIYLYIYVNYITELIIYLCELYYGINFLSEGGKNYHNGVFFRHSGQRLLVVSSQWRLTHSFYLRKVTLLQIIH
jgi:hypothetical protein